MSKSMCKMWGFSFKYKQIFFFNFSVSHQRISHTDNYCQYNISSVLTAFVKFCIGDQVWHFFTLVHFRIYSKHDSVWFIFLTPPHRCKMAQESGWGVMVSHRSGETEDTFIADLVVGLCTGQVNSDNY